MLNFTFWSPTKFIFGKGVETQCGENVAKFGGRNVLVIYGGGSAIKNGLLLRVEESLVKNQLNYVTLGGVQPNPIDTKVYEAVEICKSNCIDFILAVGGGSVIDTAKAVAAAMKYNGDFWDFFSGKAEIKDALPVGVILTIPAAGSEGSGNSVITRTSDKIKNGVRTEYFLRPKFALMNPELTYSLPPFQTAAGIVDMMAHIFERYFTTTSHVEITDRLAEGCLITIMEQARKVFLTPNDYDTRANIMWCGTLAHNGLCGTGREEDWSSHALEHELSALYGVTHGAGLAVVMPAWMTYVAGINPTRGAQFAIRVMNVIPCANDYDTAMAGIDKLKEFFLQIGMPVTLAGLGIANPDIELMVKKVHALKGNPMGGYVKLSPADTRQIYELMK